MDYKIIIAVGIIAVVVLWSWVRAGAISDRNMTIGWLRSLIGRPDRDLRAMFPCQGTAREIRQMLLDRIKRLESTEWWREI